MNGSAAVLTVTETPDAICTEISPFSLARTNDEYANPRAWSYSRATEDSSVLSGSRTMFTVSLKSHGFVGDVDLDTEQFEVRGCFQEL